MSAWIKCSDMLPASNIDVLVWHPCESVKIGHYDHSCRTWRNAEHERDHWQMLPEPPSESTDAPLEHAKAAMDAAEEKANR